MCKDHLKPGRSHGALDAALRKQGRTRPRVSSPLSSRCSPTASSGATTPTARATTPSCSASSGLPQFDVEKLQARLDRSDHARVKESLAQVGFHSALDLLGTYAGQAADLQEWMRDAQISTDRNLRLQYLAGFWLNSYVGSEILAEIARHYEFPDNLFVGSAQIKQALKARHLGRGAQSGGPLEPSRLRPNNPPSWTSTLRLAVRPVVSEILTRREN